MQRLTTFWWWKACVVLGTLTAAPAGAAETAEPWSAYTLFRKPPRPAQMVVDGFLWVEAEDFRDYGDWRLDTQFVAQMGSAYLIAAGVGKPIADTTTEVAIPRAGTYRLWVRTKNWIQAHAPGKFAVSVGAERSAHVFGAAGTEAWGWESGGEFALAAGPVRLALHDLTGYFGRCDALLLTTDRQYTPPDDLEKLAAERTRLAGVTSDEKDEGTFDVVVVGAGAAGCCAAIAAARLGAQTALIQNRPVLGGNASDELGVGICGASVSHPNARESGLIEEAGRVKAHFHFQRMSEAFRAVAEGEPRLQIFYNRHVIGAALRDPAQLAAVTAVDTLSGAKSVFRGRLFIDCTGDGWVGYYAGAKFRLGREAREEFGEDLAPPASDTITMSGCLMGNYTVSYRAQRLSRPVTYVPPPWAAQLPPPDQFGRRIDHIAWGDWWLEHAGEIDDLWDPERARDELLRISFGYWDFIKNRWAEREQAAHYTLAFVPYMNAKRETRRLTGDYIFRQQDALEGRVFDDRISYGGWPLDVHHARGIYSGAEGPFHCNPHVPLYTIPYRILYSVNIDNLLFAGRHVSTTHIGLGTLRVQGTLATLGQAAGTAAGLCLRHGCTPRALGQQHLGQLQQTLLKHDQYIPELKNEDPDDLARTATVSASSTAAEEEFGRAQIVHRDAHPLNMARAVLFPRGVHEQLEAVSVVLYSESDQPTPVTLHVRGAAGPEDLSATTDLATATATVAPGKLAWVKFPVGCRIETPYFWVWLPKTPGLSWRLMQAAPYGSCRAYGGDRQRPWTVVKGQYYTCLTEPPITTRTDYRPENVINGVARIVGTASNLWASDPHEPMPQWLELAFPQPAQVSTVYLTFDTDLNTRYHDEPLPRRCVRDYRLAYFDGTQWHELAVEKDNFQRRRVHRFAAVTAHRLRLTVDATGGDPSARVFEIRAYPQ